MPAHLSDQLKTYIDDSKVFATVATVQPDGRPHLTVVWIMREGDDLIFSTTVDRQQGRNATRDPRVTLLISPPDDPYVYAEIRGTATVVPDPQKQLPDTLSLKYTGKTFAGYSPEAAANDSDRIIVRVTPDKVISRF